MHGSVSGTSGRLLLYEGNWVDRLANLFNLGAQRGLHLIGVGNPMRKDDGLGIRIITGLRKRCGHTPDFVKIHPPSDKVESLKSGIDYTKEKALIFDAVEFDSLPGSIIFSKLNDSRFGFFGTHNIPIRALPNVSSHLNNLLILGIQPGNLEVGEGLSYPVGKSVEEVVSAITGMLRK